MNTPTQPRGVLLWSDYVSPYAIVAKASAFALEADYEITLAFGRFWRHELDPEDGDAVAALLLEAGAPPGFAAFLAGEGGAAHDRLRNEAEASGVFGVPTFVFEGELFWGGDRIGLLRERLDEKRVKRRPV